MDAEKFKKQDRVSKCLELMQQYPDITSEHEKNSLGRLKFALRFF